MPVSQFRVYFNNAPASSEQLQRFVEIRVEQGIGMASEAQLQLAMGAADTTGSWDTLSEDFVAPDQRVRVEVKVGEGNFEPLIDGTIVGQRFAFSAQPNESHLTLIVHDDSALLNRDEGVEMYEEMAPHDIASLLFQNSGLQAEVDTTQSPAGGLERVIIRRGTAMQLLLELARRHGMFVYVRPGDSPGSSVGVFMRPDLSPAGLPELVCMGEQRNVHRFDAQFDAMRPMTARAVSLSIKDQTTLSGESQDSSLNSLGDETAHSITSPIRVLLARTREDQADLDDATAAAVDFSSWAFTANAEVAADMYEGVLTPYQVISVSGIGPLSGDYLISRVSHVISDEQYKQTFTLRRNARSTSNAANSLASAVASVF